MVLFAAGVVVKVLRCRTEQGTTVEEEEASTAAASEVVEGAFTEVEALEGVTITITATITATTITVAPGSSMVVMEAVQ